MAQTIVAITALVVSVLSFLFSAYTAGRASVTERRLQQVEARVNALTSLVIRGEGADREE